MEGVERRTSKRSEKAVKLIDAARSENAEIRRHADIELQYLAYEEALERDLFTIDDWRLFGKYADAKGYNKLLGYLVVCFWVRKPAQYQVGDTQSEFFKDREEIRKMFWSVAKDVEIVRFDGRLL